MHRIFSKGSALCYTADMVPKICLVLTENTIDKNIQLIERYRPWIDIVELRADFLDPQELLHIRMFPKLAHIPAILTIRRFLDGGAFKGGEGSRITLFARGLAFADTEPLNNFAYLDLESDVQAPSLEEAAQAFNIGIIRSVHSIKTPIKDIAAKIREIRRTDEEIVKIAYKADNLADVTALFKQAQQFNGQNILIAMGKYGIPSRILAAKLHSPIVYTMPREYIAQHHLEQEFIDPITLNELYRFRTINDETRIYGVVGTDTTRSLSPAIHNSGFARKNINAVYIPISAANSQEVIPFADCTGIAGLSVTHPFKFDIIPFLDSIGPASTACGAVNTVLFDGGKRRGFNTDIDGFSRALQEFLHVQSLRFKHVAIIGTGGAAHAIANALHLLHGKACVFGRSAEKAKQLAERYNFRWAVSDLASVRILKKYSDIIIQATSVGMHEDEDPLEFYSFSGAEKVFDVIYTPEKTALLKRAEAAGCDICNGYNMLRYQAYKQFELFTGGSYE
nr:type I 3-dehydroquinate dehydratase [Treponema medium]